MTYVKVNLNRPKGIAPGSGSGMDTVYILDQEDVLVYPPRDGNGVKHLGNFVMKSEGNFIAIYNTKSKGEAPVESDGDEDSVSIKQMMNLQHPGNEDEVKEFVQNWLGKNVYILHKSCNSDHYEVLGTPCAPLQLKPGRTLSNDGKYWSLKFEAFANSEYVPGTYYGEVITAEPTDVVDATEIDLLKANGFQYRLPATSSTTLAAIASIDLDHKKVVTLIGSGGSTPTTLASGASTAVTVILKDGTTWTALNNAVLQLQVFKAGATTYLIELSRA